METFFIITLATLAVLGVVSGVAMYRSDRAEQKRRAEFWDNIESLVYDGLDDDEDEICDGLCGCEISEVYN